MTDTSKRPEWLPNGWTYSEAELPLCDICRQRYAAIKLDRLAVYSVVYLCDSPACESAAREAIGGEE